jgi:hypothetical protein
VLPTLKSFNRQARSLTSTSFPSITQITNPLKLLPLRLPNPTILFARGTLFPRIRAQYGLRAGRGWMVFVVRRLLRMLPRAIPTFLLHLGLLGMAATTAVMIAMPDEQD